MKTRDWTAAGVKLRKVDWNAKLRMERAKQQRNRILRGEIRLPLHDPRIIRISEYKARKARQVVWENESTAETMKVQS